MGSGERLEDEAVAAVNVEFPCDGRESKQYGNIKHGVVHNDVVHLSMYQF